MPAPSYKGDDPYIFVSYAHSEMDVVGAEIDRLSASGVNVWYDEGISPGQEWSEELGHAITGASCFVFFVSANSTTSKHCRNELQLAINRNVPVIAVHLEETQLSDGLELSLGATQAIFKHRLDESTYRKKLAEAIGSVGPAPPSTGLPPTPPRKRLGVSMIASAAVVVLALGALGWWASDRPDNDSRPDLGTQETSIAVLPFANLSTDPANRFFAAGVHEDILTELSRMSDLIVISRSSVMQYQDQTVNIKDVAKAMNVTHVLEGSARQIGNLVRVNVQLIEAATDQHIWAESFDGELTDIFRLQNEIAFSVANQLSIKLSDNYQGERRAPSPQMRGRSARRCAQSAGDRRDGAGQAVSSAGGPAHEAVTAAAFRSA